MSSSNFFFDKVLIIDDGEVERFVCAAFLKKQNITNEILHFGMAEDAINYLKDKKDDFRHAKTLILLDIQMPQMDGFEFLEKAEELLRSIQQNCLLVMYSSSIDANEIKRAEENPFVKKFISKPMNREKFQVLKECCFAVI